MDKPVKNTKAGRDADLQAEAFPDGHYPEHTEALIDIARILSKSQAYRRSNVKERLWNFFLDRDQIMLGEEVDDLITDLEKAGILLIPIVKK